MGLREEYCLRLHCRLLFVCIKQKGMIFSFASNFAEHSHQKSSKYATNRGEYHEYLGFTLFVCYCKAFLIKNWSWRSLGRLLKAHRNNHRNDRKRKVLFVFFMNKGQGYLQRRKSVIFFEWKSKWSQFYDFSLFDLFNIKEHARRP